MKMVSSKYKVELRPNLYYNKYKYRAKFNLMGVDRTRYTLSIIEYKNRLDDTINNFNEYHNFVGWLKSIDLNKISLFLNWKRLVKKDKDTIMIRVENDTCVVYSNDTSHFDALLQFGDNFEYFQADDSVPTGTIYFSKDPKHNYRVYFKSIKVKPELKNTLLELQQRYTNQIFFSKALTRWLKNKNPIYARNNFYIDYDIESTYTILSLTVGEIFDVNYKCIKKPKD